MNEQPDLRASLKAALAEIEALQAQLDTLEEPVAIVGIGCRLPGANDADEAWERLRQGEIACREPPATRAGIAASFDPDPDAPGRTYCAKAGYLDGLEMFDAGFFRMLPAQAVALDPQQRMLLETSWNAIEDAGIDPASLKGSRTGVYVGLSFDDYAARVGGDPTRFDPASILGAARSLAAGRISYFLDLKGPSVQLDTACSSAAVALHQAARALRSGDCDLAIAGGANAIIEAETMVRLSKLKALSPHGRCRSFEAAADGYGRGEGAVVFLLSRLSDALARRQRIYAVIRGSAVNHDGASNGLTAPNGRAQEAVVRAALDDARADPADVAFVEAHGTGTPLGDPIEAAALARVFADRSTGDVLLGSSKALFGHLEAAAGALGVLKAALCLDRGALPAQPRGTEITPRIDWRASPLRLVLEETRLPPARPLAGVSSFGMSGTNAHIVLERAPPAVAPVGDTIGLAFLSAGGKAALRRRADELSRWIRSRPDLASADLERSLLARGSLSHRAVFDLADPASLAERLQAFADGDDTAALASGAASREEIPAPITSWVDRDSVVRAFVSGAPIDPGLAARHGGRPLSLPTYPFERSRYWIEESLAPPDAGRSPPAEVLAPAQTDDVKESLRALLSKMLGVPAQEVDDRTPFVEMGGDSLILLDAVRAIEQRYGLEIPMGQLFAGLSTIDALAAYVAEQGGAAAAPGPLSSPLSDGGDRAPSPPQPSEPDPTGQSRYFETLVEAHAQRHAGSKARANASRLTLADSRRAVGFRPSVKEALFPIVGGRGEGAYFQDVDGNRFVDVAMGFGVYLFGHAYAPVEEAIDAARRAALPIGPQSADAGEVAEALCQMTGFERAAFCNTGTEAVMTALRLARAATRRNGVALFSGSYHGHFDGVLGASGAAPAAVPATPGVSSAFVSDLLVLDYGAESALEAIERHGRSLAAVLVEPVQSRNPGLQPAAFLRRLRELADQHGFALIFDEVLTGLRVHPAGAHGLLGVKPDIATYGKILGGGLPVGAVAGSRRFLDGIDGGAWNYGDASAPLADRVFFGGTFNKNATSMAAAKAVLGELTRSGPQLQAQLNARTDAMVRRLQEGIRSEDLPVSVQHFGSLFRFGFSCNPDAFYLELACRGVYVWEGRNCFLSTAHDDAAVDHIVEAVMDSLRSMRTGGLLDAPEKKAARPPVVQGTSAFGPPRAVAAALTAAGLPEVGSDHDERTRRLDAAATGFAVEALRALALEAGLEETLDPDLLAERLGVPEAGRKLIACLIAWLVKDDLIEADGDGWRWRAGYPGPDIAGALGVARALGGEAEAALLERAGSALADVLRRSRHALDALCPGGDFGALSDVYVRPALAKAANRLLGEACRTIAATVPASVPLDILELGAGTGSATATLLEALGDRPFRYRATDVSTAFFDPARWPLGPDDRLSFGRYDIDQAVQGQGLPAGGFDLIVASNCLHVAQDLDFTLDQIASLLKPGGVLVLDELTAAPRWLQLTFGITEGWWKHHDGRRAADTPLLSTSGWEAALSAAGLPLAASVSPVGPGAEPGAAIVMGQKRSVSEVSRAQQELVALAAFDDDGARAYNLAMVVEIDGGVAGAIGGDRLGQAIVDEARAHDALSAVFVEDPSRMVFGAAEIEPGHRLNFSQEPDPAARAEAWCTAFADAPFDLGQGPLFRSAILDLGGGRLRAVLSAPHVVADAMSLALVWEGAVRRYAGLPAGPAPSFAKHLEVERRWLAGLEAESLRAFWRSRLSAPGSGGEVDWTGGTVQERLGSGLGQAVRRRAIASGATPFMLYFAAFALLLNQEGDGRGAVIGMPVSGRRRAAHGLVGYCTHVLPVGVAAPAGGSIRAYLDAVRETLVDAYSHQDLPFAEMRRGTAARIDVTFNLDDGALGAPDGASARVVGWQTRREPFPLRVNLTAMGDDVMIEVGHQFARHGRDDAVRIIEQYRDLLQRIAGADDDTPVSDIAPGALAPAAGPRAPEPIVEETPAVPAGPTEMTEVERCLAEAIGRALNIEGVGPDDDFFELGGDSIVSLQAASAARRAGYAVDAKAILSHRTVRAMARHAASAAPPSAAAQTASPATPPVALGEDEYAALVSVFED